MVVLDSDHSSDHVLAELRAYSAFIETGGYMIAENGIMGDLAGAPRSEPDWASNNAREAVRDFIAADDRFALVEPKWLFNEGLVRQRVTYWPSSHVKRIR